MSQTQQINCPNCGSSIEFQINELLSGAKFSCSHCDASIALANDSLDQVKQSMDQFDRLKHNKLKE